MADCLEPSACPHQLPWKATKEERAIVCALRRSTNFALNDLTFVVCQFLPHLNRDSIWRILKAEGLNRRPKPITGKPARSQGTFRDFDLGSVHIDINEHLNAKPEPANPAPQGRAGPCDATKARLIADATKDVPQLDTSFGAFACVAVLKWRLKVKLRP